MFNKIVLGFLAFLLWIFPNSVDLRASQQKRSFDMDTSVNMVMDAIKANDIDALEAMMCLNIKTNINDLPTEIGKLIDAFDGDTISVSPWERTYTRTSTRSDSQLIHQSVNVKFTTEKKEYFLGITWGIVDTKAPEELGIRRITLVDPAQYGTDGHLLATISATENY